MIRIQPGALTKRLETVGTNSLRDAAAKISQDLGLTSDEFEAQFASMSVSGGGFARGPQARIDAMTSANTAAVQLRTLGGYVEGAIEAVVRNTPQVEVGRGEAAEGLSGRVPWVFGTNARVRRALDDR